MVRPPPPTLLNPTQASNPDSALAWLSSATTTTAPPVKATSLVDADMATRLSWLEDKPSPSVSARQQDESARQPASLRVAREEFAAAEKAAACRAAEQSALLHV